MAEKSNSYQKISSLSDARLLCVGDVMLDRFVYGAVDRISPEAPIPVLRVTREKHMPGGVGNVALNVAALGAAVTLIAVIGRDSAGQELENLLKTEGIVADLVAAPTRQTTVKSRFISANQQVLRVDREETAAIDKITEESILTALGRHIAKAQAIILSDYKKGLLTPRVIEGVIAAARKAGIPVIVDPKDTNFAIYKGATVITPNRKELEAASAMTCKADDEVRAACMKQIAAHGFQAVLATRSQDGMSLVQQTADPLHIPAQVRDIYDVSGAGDTVIAVFATGLAAGMPMQEAARIANAAAGIVVGKPGMATARIDEIEEALLQETAVAGHFKKITASKGAADAAERCRVRGKRIGFTNGCFDLLHPGHLSTLQQARAACDFLIVGLNSDASVRRLKGPTRPVQDERARAAVLAALADVDMVVIFEEDTPLELIRAIRPDVLVKGGQYKLEEVVGYEVVTSYGGKIVRAEMADGFSTTNTISKMAG